VVSRWDRNSGDGTAAWQKSIRGTQLPDTLRSFYSLYYERCSDWLLNLGKRRGYAFELPKYGGRARGGWIDRPYSVRNGCGHTIYVSEPYNISDIDIKNLLPEYYLVAVFCQAPKYFG
jgi:hypothetical protein